MAKLVKVSALKVGDFIKVSDSVWYGEVVDISPYKEWDWVRIVTFKQGGKELQHAVRDDMEVLVLSDLERAIHEL